MNGELSVTQKRALAVVTVIALALAYFLRQYFVLIVVAGVVAYLFTPMIAASQRGWAPVWPRLRPC